MSYSHHDSSRNVWRAPASRERAFKSNFRLPPQLPTYVNPSEHLAMNGVWSLPDRHPTSMPLTSVGYPQALYSDRLSERFAEEAPDSTSVTAASNIDAGPRIYQGSSNQASTTKEGREVIHLAEGTSHFLPNLRDSNLLPSSASLMPSGRDLNSLQLDSGCYPMKSLIAYPLPAVSYSQMANLSRKTAGLGTRDQEPGPQKKTESWLIAKFLDSVHSSENQPRISTADSAHHPQTIPMNLPAGSRPQPDVQSSMGRYSKDPVASAAVDLEKSSPIENPGYSWHPPPSNLTMQNASPEDSEKVVSSSKMKQDEKLQKQESGVDSGTLGAWTEYFRQLYLFNVINHQQGDEARPHNVQGVDVAPSLLVDPPKPVAKLGYMGRGRGRQLHKPLAATTGSGQLGVGSIADVVSSRAAGNRPTERKLLGCRLCGLEDMHWNVVEFQEHVTSEEHRRRYKKQTVHLDSTSDPQCPQTLRHVCCRMCNLTITESFSIHKRRPEHLERTALIQRGCQLCKMTGFQYYKDYSTHMNGKEHRENQIKSQLQNGSSAKNTDNSVNVVDSTQDKSINPDSSGSPNEATPKKKNSQMITQSLKLIRPVFRPAVLQKPKIEIKLSPRQPLLGLGRNTPGRGLVGNKRMVAKLDISEVVMVEDDTGEELQKRLKIGNVAEPSVGCLPTFPATTDATEEQSRREASSQDNLQVIYNTAAADKLSLKDAGTPTVIQAESGVLECQTSPVKTSNGAEEAAALLSAPPSEVEAESSSKGSAEPNSGPTPDQQNEDDVFVAVVGFYCKVCRTIYNKEEVSEDQHRKSETHLINLQPGVHLSSSSGPSSSLPLSTTSKQSKHSKQDVNMPQKNVTDTSRVVDGAHQKMTALKTPGNAAKDQNLISQLEEDIFSQHLVCLNANFKSQDCAWAGNDLVKHSTCKSSGLGKNSTEISSPRQLAEQGPKKMKATDGSTRVVEQQGKDDNELELSDLETTGNCSTRQRPRKRKLIQPKSCMMSGNSQENNRDVQKRMEDILEEIVAQGKTKDTQTQRQEVENRIQTTNEEFKARSNVSNEELLVNARTENLPRKLVHTGSTAAGKSDTIAFVEVKEKPSETDASLISTTVKENSYLKIQDERIDIDGQNLKTNRQGIDIPIQTHFPSTNVSPQSNESKSCTFNQPSVKHKVVTTKESNLQSGMLPEAFAPNATIGVYTTDPSSESESKKNNSSIQMNERVTMPARNDINDNITETSVCGLADKDPGIKLNSGAAINPGVNLNHEAFINQSGVKLHNEVVSRAHIDLFGHVNGDVKNTCNANKQTVCWTASDGKKPDNGKTVTIDNSVNSDKAVTGDEHVTSEGILASSTAVSGDTGNKAAERTAVNDISGDKSTTQKNTVPAVATSPVDDRAGSEDDTTRQNVACDKSVVDRTFSDKTVVYNKTGKATTEGMAGSKVGNIAAVTINTAQSASNHKHAADVANSNTQDAKSKTNNSPTVSAENVKSINEGVCSTFESCQTDHISNSVGATGVGSSNEVPELVDSSKHSDSSINTESEVADSLLPAILEKGCAVS